MTNKQQVKMLIPEKKKLVHQSLGRQLDAWENECIPKVTMSTNAVVFARTAFDTPVTQTLKVVNTGQVQPPFGFCVFAFGSSLTFGSCEPTTNR